MLTGWQKVSGKWCYFGSDGAMQKNTWVGNYWLKADGVMATNQRVDGGRVSASRCCPSALPHASKRQVK